MRRVGQARKGPMLLKLYGPKPGPARRTQARGPARPDVLRPEARPGPRGLRARAGLATSSNPRPTRYRYIATMCLSSLPKLDTPEAMSLHDSSTQQAGLT